MAHDSFVLLDAAPGADDPLGMLGACHRRLEARLASLERLIEVFETGDAARYPQAAEAAGRVIAHMQGPAATHHLDEELSLFPRLTAVDAEATGLIQTLERAHDTLDGCWRAVQPALARIRAGEAPDAEAVTALKAAAAALVDGYRAHIADEETQLFTRAREALDAGAIAEIGAEMRDRRHRP